MPFLPLLHLRCTIGLKNGVTACFNPPSPTSKCVHNGFVMNTLIFLWREMFLCAEVFYRNALSGVRDIGFLFNFLGKFQCSDKAVINYNSLCVGF